MKKNVYDPVSFSFEAVDGKEIQSYKWYGCLPKNDNYSNTEIYRNTGNSSMTLKGIVHIIHGMGEHALRYNEFAAYLNSLGFAVYAMDQRGHGKTAGNVENLGHQADENGWSKVVGDIRQLNEIIQKENPRSPLFLFGHSAGSFLTRDYIISFPDEIEDRIAGVVLSGTAASPGLLGNIGILLAKYFIKKGGPKVKSPLHRDLTFGKYNKHFKPNRTTADWISRDSKVVDKMLNDPYCYTLFSATFYMELARSTIRINQFKNIKKMPPQIPVFLISGTQCSVGNYTKGIKKVYNDFVSAGIKDVELKLYEGARHELTNELNRDEVFSDIGSWLKKHI